MDFRSLVLSIRMKEGLTIVNSDHIPVGALDDFLFTVRCCAVGAFTYGDHGDAVCGNGSVLAIFHIKDGF